MDVEKKREKAKNEKKKSDENVVCHFYDQKQVKILLQKCLHRTFKDIQRPT